MFLSHSTVNSIALRSAEKESTRIQSDTNDEANRPWLKNVPSTNNTEKIQLPVLKLSSCAELTKEKETTICHFYFNKLLIILFFLWSCFSEVFFFFFNATFTLCILKKSFIQHLKNRGN